MTATLERPAATPAALLDVGAVADLLGCSPRHVYRLADRGAMPRPVKFGRLIRWRCSTGDPMTGLQDWIDAGCPSCREGHRR
jgi:predicted DNA-binding transcriptional regulator AlpA